MNRYITIFLGICYLSISYQVKAQFNLVTDFGGQAKAAVFSSLIHDNNKLLVLGELIDTVMPSLPGKVSLASFSLSGNNVKLNTFRASGTKSIEFFQNSLINSGNNKYAANGITLDSTGFVVGAFIKYDSNLTPVFYKEYTEAGLRIYGKRLITYGNDFIQGWLINHSTGKSDIRVVRTDSLGNIKWLKTFGNGNSLNENVNGLCINSRNEIVVSGSAYYTYPQTTNVLLYTYLLVLDSAGNKRHEYLDTDSSSGYWNEIQPTLDGGYITCGNYVLFKSQSEGYYYKAALAKWDSAFNRQWLHLYGDSSAQIEFLTSRVCKNGDIISCGQALKHYTVDTFGFYGWLQRTDKNGNIKWSKLYKGLNTPNRSDELNNLTDVEELPDGRLAACGVAEGQVPGQPLQRGWLLLVDSNGCLLDSCGVNYTSIDVVAPLSLGEVLGLRIFPNPASSYCFIDYGNLNWEASHNVQLQVTNLLGESLYHTQLPEYSGIHKLDMQDYSSGLYVVTLSQGGQVVWKGKIIKE